VIFVYCRVKGKGERLRGEEGLPSQHIGVDRRGEGKRHRSLKRRQCGRDSGRREEEEGEAYFISFFFRLERGRGEKKKRGASAFRPICRVEGRKGGRTGKKEGEEEARLSFSHIL